MTKLGARAVTIGSKPHMSGGINPPDMEIVHSNGFKGLRIYNGAGMTINVWMSEEHAKALSQALLEKEQLELTA